ncbi:hypothetical protein RHGRI_007866 [Rhododendron griersonianum]|uniref:Peptidase A1 domain-containing protein n=1 Tax=Rhododendron griersonianum TaxID=479676 RepID=A0AAV6KYG9_9ERIC|nr:hypothetical protein RHGRI_007866 [Rhododendron griersonianum]
MTQVSVGDNVTDISFNAIFDSGTSFTYLNDPALRCPAVQFPGPRKRHPSDYRIPFAYCYDLMSIRVNTLFL